MSEISQPAGSAGSNAGAYSLGEILSQAECWRKGLQELQDNGASSKIQKRFGDSREWLFIGCGSSYYVALAIAAAWNEIAGRRARAVPASELLAFPEAVLASETGVAPVLISRSGHTSEVVRAAELLKQRSIPSLGVTCTAGQALEQLATTSIVAPVDELSMVMTASFTSMLLSLQYVGASLGGRSDTIAALMKLADVVERPLDTLPARIREFVGRNQFADYVFLGQGPYYGLACEAALKVTEMSCSYAQAFHTLEFRHGPKSIVGPETLLTFLLSEANYQAEREVLEEMKKLGATTLVIANNPGSRTRAAADFLYELGCDLREPAYLAAYAFIGQLLGLYTGLQKGLDPDRPRNLSRVVILQEEGLAVKP